MAQNSSGEVKPSFSIRYIFLHILLGILNIAVTSMGTIVFTKVSKEDKVINVSTSASNNLATLPEAATKKLEVYMSLFPDKKELVRSLFRYEIGIANKTSQGIDDFIVTFVIPQGIHVPPEPETHSNPANLVRAIKIEKMASESDEQKYKISLLNPGQSINFSYFGYAVKDLQAEPIKVVVQKKDWGQKSVENINVESTRDHGLVDQIAQKRLAEMTGLDAILLSCTVMGVYFAFRIYGRLLSRLFA